MSIPQKENPVDLFREWFQKAHSLNLDDPTAMSLSTVDERGRPRSRMVLLKDVGEEGFVFYTNLESNKGKELKAHPFAALCFYWNEMQVRVNGAVEGVSDEEADLYFQSRPRESRIGAWASLQSRPLESTFALEKRVALFTAKYGFGTIPRPPHWSGYRVVPDEIEFWLKKPFRLHERLLYTRSGEGWQTENLYP